MMVQHIKKIRADNSYQLHWNYFTVSRDSRKHTVNATRLDKILQHKKIEEQQECTLKQFTYISPE